MIRIAPSILSADFARLGDQVREAEQSGADWIHLDVMDGHFVPNLTIGPAIVAAVRRSTGLPLDVHLMIEQPERFISAFVEAGADSLTVHVETCPHLHRTLEQIHEAGARAGVALNPGTPPEAIREVLPFVDLVLVMTVNPGFGGQSYISTVTSKIARVRELLDARDLREVALEVDGGVSAETVSEPIRAGADVIVAGSAVYGGAGSVEENLRLLREAAVYAAESRPS